MGSSIISEQLQRTIDIWMGEKCTNMQDRTLQGQRKATKKVQAPHQHSPPPAPTTREEGGRGRGRDCGAAATTLPVPRTREALAPSSGQFYPRAPCRWQPRLWEPSRAREGSREREERGAGRGAERSGEQSRAKQGSERTGCPSGRAARRTRAGAMQRSTLRPWARQVQGKAEWGQADGHGLCDPEAPRPHVQGLGCVRRRHSVTAQEAPASGTGPLYLLRFPRPPNETSGKPCKDQVNDP